MKNTKNHPGVIVPPPLFLVALFFLSRLLDARIPLHRSAFDSDLGRGTGWLLMLLSLVNLVPAVFTFLQTGNTVVTIKPAHSLQTTGIYSFSRNPMYLGLLLLYTGLALLKGNWWTLLLLPALLLILDRYVIQREERYLERRFGQPYLAYKRKVRRWL